MGETLYRKYRPQIFADITGQEHIVKTLCAQLMRGTVAHAYLFSGTRGTGKTTTARVFAKALNCATRAGVSVNTTCEPCGVCASCTDITASRSIDVIEMDAATHTGVDTVREHIIENARTLPTRDRHKIFIIDEVHMLSTSSFNALLKTLEEPPSHVIYILATTELHKIPATVASRCQRFLFRPLSPARMAEKIRRIAAAEYVVVDDSVVGRIIGASGGAMRDAESLLGQLMAMDAQHITDAHADIILSPRHTEECIAVISALIANKQIVALDLIEKMYERGVDLALLHDELITHAHELLVISAVHRIPEFLGVFSESETTLLTTAARGMKTAWLASCIEKLIETKQLQRSISSSLAPLHVWVASYEQTKTAAISAVIQAVPPTIASAAPMPPMAYVFDEEQIRKNWDDARAKLSASVPSLGIILSSAQLVSIIGGQITITVPVAFYRDKLSELSVKRQLQDALSIGCDAPVECSITFTPAMPMVSENPLVDVALKTFGGTVVA